VAYALERWAGYWLRDEAGHPVSWRTVSPDRLDDLLALPVNGARVIYSSLE